MKKTIAFFSVVMILFGLTAPLLLIASTPFSIEYQDDFALMLYQGLSKCKLLVEWALFPAIVWALVAIVLLLIWPRRSIHRLPPPHNKTARRTFIASVVVAVITTGIFWAFFPSRVENNAYGPQSSIYSLSLEQYRNIYPQQPSDCPAQIKRVIPPPLVFFGMPVLALFTILIVIAVRVDADMIAVGTDPRRIKKLATLLLCLKVFIIVLVVLSVVILLTPQWWVQRLG